MKGLSYAFSFVTSCIATAVLAIPMPFVVQNKAELGQVLQDYIDKKTLEFNFRSYNNNGLMALTGFLALGSFGFLVKELSDKPIIPSLPQPQNTPVVFNNNNMVKVSIPTQSKKKEYTPDLQDRNQDPYEWINGLHEVNCLLIYGEQGSGKTTFVKAEVEARQALGHDVIVFDPHREYGAWDGLDVTGDGRNYAAIDEALLDIQKLIDNRYIQYSTVKDFSPKPITIICEEFTQWNDKCENSDAFFSAALSDVRKVRIHVLFVAHGDTLGNLTKKSGMGKNRDLGMTKLELIGKPSPTGKTIPSGKGNLYLQRSGNVPTPVSIPDLRQQTEDPIDDLFDTPLDNVIPLRRAS